MKPGNLHQNSVSLSNIKSLTGREMVRKNLSRDDSRKSTPKTEWASSSVSGKRECNAELLARTRAKLAKSASEDRELSDGTSKRSTYANEAKVSGRSTRAYQIDEVRFYGGGQGPGASEWNSK